MKEILLRYGKEKVCINIPEKNLKEIVEPDFPKLQNNFDNKKIIYNSIKNSNVDLLENISGKKIMILCEDDTRNTPHFDILEPLLDIISAKPDFIKIMIATGTHNSSSEGNLALKTKCEQLLEKFNFQNYKVLIHNCFTDSFAYFGKTIFNNEIYINEEITDCDSIIILSDVKLHYFAGYSNFVKLIMPGISAFKTIEKNHSFALEENSTFGRHPLHYDKTRRSNKVAEDMYEIYNTVTKNKFVFLISVITLNQNIVWSAAGLPEKIIMNAFKFVDDNFIKTVEPSERIIVCPGGYPEDESLYNSQRALELTKEGVCSGGEILFISACENGIAPNKEAMKNFYFKMQNKNIDKILESISEEYHLYEHKAYKFALLMKNIKIYMYSELADEVLKSINIIPVVSPQEIIDRWIKENSNVLISVFNNANKLSIFRK